MAIEFHCPHCQHFYRLKDDLAGKRATCKNPSCRRTFTIPTPLRAEEIESVAVSLLADDPPTNAPAETEQIAMNCDYCGHSWQEPRSKAGKNVLCPECRQRLRVPEPKATGPADWRNAQSRLPSLARQNQEKLDGVVDASEAALVSGQALLQAGVTEVELEPRPLREKLLIAGFILALLGIISGSIYFFLHRRQVRQGAELLAQIHKYWDEGVAELNDTEAALGTALLHLVLAEEALRYEQPQKLKEAHSLLQKARQELRNAPNSTMRHVVVLEGAVLTIQFGGEAEQVAAQTRFVWLPETGGRGALRQAERQRSVHEELRLFLSLLSGADYDLRLCAAHRLNLLLLDRAQSELALESLPLLLFQDNERNEVRALLALQAYQRQLDGERIIRLARKLLPDPKGSDKESAPTAPTSPAVMVLWQAASIEQAPPLPPLPSQGPLPDSLRFCHTLHLSLKGEHDEALKVAQRSGPAEVQLKALLLGAECCAARADQRLPDWLKAAENLVANNKGKSNVRFPDGQLLRLCQLAGASNFSTQQAQLFADAIRDENLRLWATAEILRSQHPLLLERFPDDRFPIPADLRKITSAHLWGRFWIARHNARLSRDLSQEQRALLGWSPRAVYAFGLAGVSLGLQDP